MTIDHAKLLTSYIDAQQINRSSTVGQPILVKIPDFSSNAANTINIVNCIVSSKVEQHSWNL